jgi:iron-sulfur cluster assembly accessory protein
MFHGPFNFMGFALPCTPPAPLNLTLPCGYRSRHERKSKRLESIYHPVESDILALRVRLARGARNAWRDYSMVQLTPVAVNKVKEILTQQTPSPVGLRVAVVGGGCSGFSYHMAFENQVNDASDNVYEFDGLKVLVDQMSEMYLDGVQVDYIETIEGSGFKFNNPNVKSTCGCGSSFSV